ncbi:MAG: hypothetical protein AAF903_03775 [Pseudomonadota bacterium]
MNSLKSQSKRAALRQLFEHWGVPVELLARVSSLTLGTINGLIAKEAWVFHAGPAPLQAELMNAYGKQLKAMEDDTETCPEKRARALGGLAKVLESITTVSVRLSSAQAKSSGDVPLTPQTNSEIVSHEDGFESEAERLAYLNDELTKRIEGFTGSKRASRISSKPTKAH